MASILCHSAKMTKFNKQEVNQEKTHVALNCRNCCVIECVAYEILLDKDHKNPISHTCMLLRFSAHFLRCRQLWIDLVGVLRNCWLLRVDFSFSGLLEQTRMMWDAVSLFQRLNVVMLFFVLFDHWRSEATELNSIQFLRYRNFQNAKDCENQPRENEVTAARNKSTAAFGKNHMNTWQDKVNWRSWRQSILSLAVLCFLVALCVCMCTWYSLVDS